MSLQKILLDKTIVRGGSWLFFERFIFILKGILLSLLFANVLPKEVFGAYQFAASIIGVACVFALPGMATAIIQGVARGMGGTLTIAVAQMFRYAFFGAVFLLCAALYVSLKEPNIGKILLFTAPILPFYAVVVGSWRAYLTGKEHFSEAAKVGITGELLVLLAMVGAVFFWPKAEGLIMVMILVPTLFYGTYLLRYLRSSTQEPSDESNLSFGKRLSWLYGIGVLASYLDKIIIGYFLGFAELALFTIASIIPDQIRDSIRVLVGFVLPGFSRMGDTVANRKLILKGIFWLFLLVTFGVLVYISLAPWLFSLLFPKYPEAISYTQVAALASLTVPFMILDSYFRALKDDQTATRVALSGYFIGTVANIIFIPLFGIWGAIAARALSLGVNAALFLLAFLRKGFFEPTNLVDSVATKTR